MTKTLRTLTVRAPQNLGILHDRRDATIRFLGRIRACADAAYAGDKRQVLIDFRPCRAVSRSACLLITAELKRTLHFAGKVNFLPPINEEVADQFDGFGLYAYFRVASPLTASQRRSRTKNALLVRSGGPSDGNDEELARRLAEVSEVATRVCGQSGIARLVEEALHEALGNAREHAYHGVNSEDLPSDRWWFAGVYDPQKNDALFYVLDHGQGIPARAQEVMADDLQAYWKSQNKSAQWRPSDQDLLEAAIKAPRISRDPDRLGRGTGLPFIANLVGEKIAGEVRILSGRSGWYNRSPGRKNAAMEHPKDLHRCYMIGHRFLGTLLCFRVSGPMEDAGK